MWTIINNPDLDTQSPYKRDFATLNKSVINYIPKCTYNKNVLILDEVQFSKLGFWAPTVLAFIFFKKIHSLQIISKKMFYLNQNQNVTRQVYNLFQDPWNDSLGFFRKVLIQKMEPKCVQKMFKKLMVPKLYKVSSLVCADGRLNICFSFTQHCYRGFLLRHNSCIGSLSNNLVYTKRQKDIYANRKHEASKT